MRAAVRVRELEVGRATADGRGQKYTGALNCSVCSSSRIVRTAVFVVPRVAPGDGVDSESTTVSLPSGSESSRIGIATSLKASSAANVSVCERFV